MVKDTAKSLWKKIYKQKRPWKKHALLMLLVGAISAPSSYYVLHRFEIGIDPQNNQCLPPYRIYLVDKGDTKPVKGTTFAFSSKYMGKTGKGIKMVDGIGGDAIAVNDEETTVNGLMVGEGLALAEESGHTPQELTRNGVIPEGRIWLMGRTKLSFDSRYWGTVPETQIIGRAYPIW